MEILDTPNESQQQQRGPTYGSNEDLRNQFEIGYVGLDTSRSTLLEDCETQVQSNKEEGEQHTSNPNAMMGGVSTFTRHGAFGRGTKETNQTSTCARDRPATQFSERKKYVNSRELLGPNRAKQRGITTPRSTPGSRGGSRTPRSVASSTSSRNSQSPRYCPVIKPPPLPPPPAPPRKYNNPRALKPKRSHHPAQIKIPQKPWVIPPPNLHYDDICVQELIVAPTYFARDKAPVPRRARRLSPAIQGRVRQKQSQSYLLPSCFGWGLEENQKRSNSPTQKEGFADMPLQATNYTTSSHTGHCLQKNIRNNNEIWALPLQAHCKNQSVPPNVPRSLHMRLKRCDGNEHWDHSKKKLMESKSGSSTPVRTKTNFRKVSSEGNTPREIENKLNYNSPKALIPRLCENLALTSRGVVEPIQVAPKAQRRIFKRIAQKVKLGRIIGKKMLGKGGAKGKRMLMTCGAKGKKLLIKGGVRGKKLVMKGGSKGKKLLIKVGAKGKKLLWKGGAKGKKLLMRGGAKGKKLIMKGGVEGKRLLMKGGRKGKVMLMRGGVKGKQMLVKGGVKGKQMFVQGGAKGKKMLLKGRVKGKQMLVKGGEIASRVMKVGMDGGAKLVVKGKVFFIKARRGEGNEGEMSFPKTKNNNNFKGTKALIKGVKRVPKALLKGVKRCSKILTDGGRLGANMLREGRRKGSKLIGSGGRVCASIIASWRGRSSTPGVPKSPPNVLEIAPEIMES